MPTKTKLYRVYNPDRPDSSIELILSRESDFFWSRDLEHAIDLYKGFILLGDPFKIALVLPKLRVLEAYTEDDGYTKKYITDYAIADDPELLELFR